MLYAMAKQYDEWPGEDYEGSSARGSMKGWFKHGLCALALWREREPDPTLSTKRSADALSRPLGAYFRVNHRDLVAMHAAISEVGLAEGTKGIADGQIEIFPKGNDPGGENVIALPMARKSVALRRDGDTLVEASEPTEIPFCRVLPQVSDPGYGPTAADHRMEFLTEFISYAERSKYAVMTVKTRPTVTPTRSCRTH